MTNSDLTRVLDGFAANIQHQSEVLFAGAQATRSACDSLAALIQVVDGLLDGRQQDPAYYAWARTAVNDARARLAAGMSSAATTAQLAELRRHPGRFSP